MKLFMYVSIHNLKFCHIIILNILNIMARIKFFLTLYDFCYAYL